MRLSKLMADNKRTLQEVVRAHHILSMPPYQAPDTSTTAEDVQRHMPPMPQLRVQPGSESAVLLAQTQQEMAATAAGGPAAPGMAAGGVASMGLGMQHGQMGVAGSSGHVAHGVAMPALPPEPPLPAAWA